MLESIKNIIPFSYRPAFLFKELINLPFVKSGPFKGLYYDGNRINNSKFPKLAGTYEKELHRFFTLENLEKFDCFIDIGAAEGYYAVGVSCFHPLLPVIAYESEIINRIWMDHLAQKNQVRKLTVKKLCTAKKLSKEVSRWNNPFVLIDVEGGEYELLKQDSIDKFKHVTLLVELHEFKFPLMNEVITQRFKTTHDILEILQESRNINDLPISLSKAQKRIFKKAAYEIMDERRPEMMKWLFITPKRNE